MAEQPLSPAVFHILLALSTGQRHGYAIMREATEAGFRMGPGTLYGSLGRLIEQGLIEEIAPRVPAGPDERRRYYRLTSRGRSTLEAESARLASLVRRAAERGVLPAASPELGS